MDRHPVASSAILSVGYDDASALLEVEFKSGRIYHYFDVPKAHFDGILSAASPNGYLTAHVKPFYRYQPA
jgi:hypothetical protein